MTDDDRFIVRIRGEQYVIIDITTGLKVGLAAGTRKRAEREADILNGKVKDTIDPAPYAAHRGETR